MSTFVGVLIAALIVIAFLACVFAGVLIIGVLIGAPAAVGTKVYRKIHESLDTTQNPEVR